MLCRTSSQAQCCVSPALGLYSNHKHNKKKSSGSLQPLPVDIIGLKGKTLKKCSNHVTAANIRYRIKLLCVKRSMMETEINISKSIDLHGRRQACISKSIDLHGRRQACIQVIFSSWNTKDEQSF